MADADSDSEPLDLLLGSLRFAPVPTLRRLRRRMPGAAKAIQQSAHLFCPLICGGDAEVAAEAEDLLSLANLAATDRSQEHQAGQRHFSHRGIEVDYWDIEETEDHLLYGYSAWPAAGLLAKLIIDATLSAADDTAEACPSRQPIPSISNVCVLELGAGVALTGLACHAAGAKEVVLTDGEDRLVRELRNRHGQKPGLRMEHLDWRSDAGDEGFDVILGSDVILAIGGGHIYAPRLVGRRLRRTPEARGLLLAPVRKVDTHLTAVAELRAQGLHVGIFIVSACILHEISTDRLAGLPLGTMTLLVADWGPPTGEG